MLKSIDVPSLICLIRLIGFGLIRIISPVRIISSPASGLCLPVCQVQYEPALSFRVLMMSRKQRFFDDLSA